MYSIEVRPLNSLASGYLQSIPEAMKSLDDLSSCSSPLVGAVELEVQQ